MKNGNACDTLEEFYAEVMEFRKLMASRAIMECEERRDGLMFGFSLTWMNLRFDGADHRKADDAFRAALDEFSARKTLVDMHLEEIRKAS